MINVVGISVFRSNRPGVLVVFGGESRGWVPGGGDGPIGRPLIKVVSP